MGTQLNMRHADLAHQWADLFPLHQSTPMKDFFSIHRPPVVIARIETSDRKYGQSEEARKAEKSNAKT